MSKIMQYNVSLTYETNKNHVQYIKQKETNTNALIVIFIKKREQIGAFFNPTAHFMLLMTKRTKHGTM